MINSFKIKLAPVLLMILLIPTLASAHQPRIVESGTTFVNDPEISKAYYGQLKGTPDTFTIIATSTFNFYVNILVPYTAEQDKSVTATVFKDGQPFTILNGTQFTWTKMFEQFGYDTYWKGPEYKTVAPPGTYLISVASKNNDSKYSLAVGEKENFDFKEILNALTLVPQLKVDYFNESPISFIFSPFGWGLILVLYILAGIAGLLYRFLLKKFTKNKVQKVSQNIGVYDRLLRLFIGIILLILAITTTWNLLLIFLSGFAVFEAIFSWCGFYAAVGKNTCPID